MRKLLLLLTALIVVFSVTAVAYAHDVSDPARQGSITVVMHYGDTIVGGGTLMLYQVGVVHEKDGNNSFVPTAEFTDWGKEFGNVQSPELAQNLKEYAMFRHLIGEQKEINQEGTVFFDGLEQGLYLLVQYKAAAGYSQVSPFLVTVPTLENGEYQYNVNASPKVELTPAPTEPTTPSAKPDEPTLPQTGQLNWPIPVLVVGGLFLFVLGWRLCFGRKKDSYEK
ncbi:MAG: hypothetical protein IJX67_08120 [Oscillospiraceae bacterium]|nr:hypothetical protein [Oscillospiraceae bacterium]